MAKISRRKNSAPLALALDIGTSSTRALVYDSNGRELVGVGAQTQYRMSASANGGVEINAEELVALVVANIDTVLAQLGERAGALAGVAATTFWHSLLAISAQGQALTPLLSWNDTRSAAVARDMRARIDEAQLHSRTGARLHASYWPAKLLWLSQTQPQLMKRARAWLSFGDYLFMRFFGEMATSISMASGTGIFHQQACRWDEETIALLPIEGRQLPALRDLDEPARGLRREFAARWPGLARIPWHWPLGDGACSNIGSDCATPQRFALMIGTSGALRAVCARQEFAIPSKLWCYRVDRQRIVMGGALANGGDLFAWLREHLRWPEADRLERELAAVMPDGHGLTVLPFFSGERSPGWRDDASGAIVGLRLSTSSIEILRAGLESIAYQFDLIYRALSAHLGTPRAIVATGGGLRDSPIWRQIIADTLGAPLQLSNVAEASSRGAALLALSAMGLLDKNYVNTERFIECCQPDQQRHQIYQQAAARQQSLYRALIENSWRPDPP
jgi:gluconokinase